MLDLKHLDWSDVLRHIQNFATSGSAKILIAGTEAFATAELAQLELQKIFNASEILNSGTRPHLESLDLYEPWYSRIKKNAVLKSFSIFVIFKIIGKSVI